ncbi:MAG: 2,3-diphosphoglycerate synthetase [Actinomycetota bacterium]
MPVIQAGLESIRNQGHELLAAVFVGGTEKVINGSDLSFLKLPVILNPDPSLGIKRALEEYKPDLIIDLSDEPVVGYKERFKFASIALIAGVSYVGSDFRFDPPRFYDVAQKPSISVIGTGKRVGKTAISAHFARVLSKAGFSPCVVAMGRGGPQEPEVVHGETIEMTPEFLLEVSQEGKHAASDHYEDALMSRILTVGCRRCGGGMAGAPFISNVLAGAELANELESDIIIFEGSGAALPPIKTDSCLVTIGAHQPIDYISGYFGTFRLFLSDLAVLTMCEEPMASEEKIHLVDRVVRSENPDLKVVHTRFRPRPLKSIRGKRVFLTTTATPGMNESLKDYLEEEFHCRVVGISNNLSNRELLRKDLLKHKGKFTTLLTELKAASVDVVTSMGLSFGADVIYADNVPITVGGDGDLNELSLDLAHKAVDNFKRKRERISHG